jgi:hypothetical protein
MVPKTLFIAQGPLEWASSRYRAWWPAKYAEWADCVQARDILNMGGNTYGYDAHVFSKWCEKPAQELAERARNFGATIVWDLCDPIHWLMPRETAEFLPLVDHIVVSSPGLAEAVIDEMGADEGSVTVIDDRMDPAYHSYGRQHQERGTPVLLWFGASHNRATLNSAALGLHWLAQQGARFKLRILDDAPQHYASIEGVSVEHHLWTLDTFHQELTDADIALCPPYPGPWGAMKSDNKEMTAWWAGLPVVRLQDYIDLEYTLGLLDDVDQRAAVGEQNREYAEIHGDVRQSVDEWEQLLVRLVQ